MAQQDIFVTRPNISPLEEYIEQIRPLWESKWLTNMGAFHQQLEEKLRQKLGVDGLSLFANGHLALEGILQAMDLSGEVITTPFSFASTTHAIVRRGLTPVFCDIQETDGTMDERRIEALITEKTSAILPVHVYGNCCNVERIGQIAKRYGLKVIYDAAHAFGVELHGKGIGSYGDASVFSFHATKVFNTIEGGAVSFCDPALALALRKTKNFGILDEETVVSPGGNAKMNEFQAAMGLCNPRHFDEEIAKRRVLVEAYREQLSGIAGIRMLHQREGVRPNYAYFPILIEAEKLGTNRDTLYKVLRDYHIFTRKYFYPLITDFDCYKAQYAQTLPVARKMASQVLTLPLYGDLGLENVEMICNAVKKIVCK